MPVSEPEKKAEIISRPASTLVSNHIGASFKEGLNSRGLRGVHVEVVCRVWQLSLMRI
jgi:hypothetical protein